MKLTNVKKVKNLEEKVNQIIENKESSKSGKMKELFTLGIEVKEISKLMNVRYNFVYNVISNLVIIEGLEVESNKQSNKKDIVKELFTQGKSSKEIAIELKTNINYIYKLVKEIKEELLLEEKEDESKVESK